MYLEENRYTQVPTVAGTLAEVVLIIRYYYQERVKVLGNATEFDALSVLHLRSRGHHRSFMLYSFLETWVWQ